MFPLRWNFPFRKKDGSMSTIEEVISEGGGGGGYTLPTASAETKGGIKIGAGLSMDGEVLNNTNPTPPTPYTLPTASADTLGGVKVGTGLSIDENGVLSSSGSGGGVPYTELSAMTYNGPITGWGLTISSDSILTITGDSSLSDTASIVITRNNEAHTISIKASQTVTLIIKRGDNITTTSGNVRLGLTSLA